jgi:hypothetical protein
LVFEFEKLIIPDFTWGVNLKKKPKEAPESGGLIVDINKMGLTKVDLTVYLDPRVDRSRRNTAGRDRFEFLTERMGNIVCRFLYKNLAVRR